MAKNRTAAPGKGSNKSALKQLRSALSTAGITKQHKQKKKAQKPPHANSVDRRQKLQSIQSSFNPFDMKINKTKFDIMGLKSKKKSEVNVAVARQKAVEKRKQTLGRELRETGRVGGISDRRIGEHAWWMAPEEKMLKRFTLERQKSSVYNLDNSDVEGEITGLTHYGRAIDEINEFSEPDDNDPVEGERFVMDEPDRKKTKTEVMLELVAKSKAHKAERQLAQQQDDSIRQELDDDFDSVRALLFADSDSKPMGKAAMGEDYGDGESYDARVRELGFERRARPQDRLKTEEEAVREEKERLERMERHRVRRMQGGASDTEDDDSENEGWGVGQRKRVPEADDLGDDFVGGDDDIGGLREGMSSGDSSEEEEGEEEEEEAEAEGSEASNEEEEEGEEDGSDLSSDESENERAEQGAAAQSASLPPNSATAEHELPYTFAAPADYAEWAQLIHGYSTDQQLTVVRRLRTLYHIRLAPQNKEKLAALAIILLEHLTVLIKSRDQRVDEFVKHVGELAAVDAERFGEHCRQLVAEMMQSEEPNVVLARVFVAVFSASDRFHPVVTPMLVAIGRFLGQTLFATRRKITMGLVLVGVVHEAQRLARRLVPEALNFLFATLVATVAGPEIDGYWPGEYPLSRRQRLAYSILTIDGECPEEIGPVRWSWLYDNGAVAESDKYAVLSACLCLCRRFIDAYFSLPAFIELFEPLTQILTNVADRLSRSPTPNKQLISARVSELQAHLAEQLREAHQLRAPLTLQRHKPLAISQVAPKFESSYSLDVHYDPDRERNESVKLRRQINREKRGAVRELRRDAQFVAGERLRAQREKDSMYKEKMKKAWGVLEDDQSQMKKLDRRLIKERKGKI
ncbi:nucleolar complex protein 14 [Coemansia spiralis]|uniref:Nucleolar complex protein 14 n=2 Tax=Coemansia TaxID=4863 RepID=A0A9W8G266_9FUNG|nr:nucleolar complex protein 14 [Coemansia umbellata]KAJ2619530.1 nucleolar complex protein 14 [Coemansia sp. RSA 1358]KAJ2671394.1 nucleolar complex protein 14 [Coemansia spiralis]